jgi:hypothetical protein
LVGGDIKQVHPSSANDWIMKEASWFTINYGEASGTLKWIYDNYKKAEEKSRKNRKYVKDNFTIEKMTQLLGDILQKHDAGKGPQQVTLQLPTLKKVESLKTLQLPTLKKPNA